MSESRVTEVMNLSTNNISRPTEVMGNIKTDNLNYSHITIGSIIGDGYAIEGIIAENTGEATIFSCSKDSKKYVAKIYHRYKRPNVDIVNIIKSIDSPYVIKILEDGEEQGRYYEILPFYEKGDLQSVLPNYDFIKNIFISSINEGLYAIHKKGIVHRDIKPNNIFSGIDGQTIVIGDFGISSQINTGMSYKLTSTSRTAGYAAPEVYNGIVSKEADYYSLGITLLHLLLQRDPFEGLNDQQIYIITCVKNLEIPSSIDENIAKLIEGLTLKDRTHRWGYNEIKRWLKNEYVEIKDNIIKRDVVPYKFIDNEYFEIEELMTALLQNWEEGKKHLYRGYLKRYVEDNFKTYGARILGKIEDCMEETNQDWGLFSLAYALNPNAPLCWKDRIFGDTIGFVDAVLEEYPNVSPYFEEILRNGIISNYLEAKGNDEIIIKTAKEYEAHENIELAYFKIIYFLDPSKPLHWRSTLYNSLDELANAFGKNYHSINKNKNIKELLLTGALEYFLKINDLEQLSHRIEEIRNNYSEDTYNRKALFDVIYELNPNALFYHGGISFKDTLELYEVLVKQTENRLLSYVKDILQTGFLYKYLKLNGRDDFAEKINNLSRLKNIILMVYEFMLLLNPNYPYYFEGKIININSISRDMSDINVMDSNYEEKACYYIRMLNTLGEYYYAKGIKEIGDKLYKLKTKNYNIIKDALELKLSLKPLDIIEEKSWFKPTDDTLERREREKKVALYTSNKDFKSVREILFQMLHIIDPLAPMNINGSSISGIIELSELLTNSLEKLKNHNHSEFICIKEDVNIVLRNYIIYDKFESSIGKENEEAVKFLKWIGDISSLSKENPDLAFWRLYFEITTKKTLYYKQEEITSIEELTDIIMRNDASGIIRESEFLLNDTYFKEWLRSIGFEVLI